MTILQYGGVSVPWTVGWTSEDRLFLDRCNYAKGPAICQSVSPGQGKPLFGKPHANRQRAAICAGLCDLCGRLLASRTKVSLSHARVVPHGAEGPAILQVEPLLHRECALESMRFCPSLKRDIADGSLKIRQVTRYRVQTALMSSEYVESLTGERKTAFGHSKVELVAWKDRDMGWLAV